MSFFIELCSFRERYFQQGQGSSRPAEACADHSRYEHHVAFADGIVGASVLHMSVTGETHQALVRELRQMSSLYEHNRDLIAIGAYHRGSDPRIDEAITRWPAIDAYLRQDMHQRVSFADSVRQLQQLMTGDRDESRPTT